jgi:tetratricopeptide (TPR) repeat protein
MARLASLLIVSFLVCPAGHADDIPDPRALEFWPEPLSKPLSQTPRSTDAGGRAEQAPSGSAGGDDEAARAASRTELAERVDQHLAALEQEEAANGERSAALIDHLTALAATYQELGQSESAVAALEDALQVARINYGLYALDQADAVESLAAIAQAEGRYAAAAGRRQYLRDLARRNADDPRAVGILHQLAEAEMAIARRLLGVPAPSQFIVNTSAAYTPVAVPQTPSLAAIRAARADYIAAIRAAVRTGTGSVEDLFALEDTLVGTVYFEFEHPEVHGPHSLYRALSGAEPLKSPISDAGLKILESRVRDNVNFGRGPEAIAKAVLEVGDWHLLFADFALALSDYEAARNLLVQRGVSAATRDALLSPELPPVLPVRSAGVGSGGHRDYRGYIEATVELTRFGDVRRVEVLGQTPGVSKAIERGFRRYLATTQFRPRFVNGEIPRLDRFDARFYFDY